jgi:hypothetical protein
MELHFNCFLISSLLTASSSSRNAVRKALASSSENTFTFSVKFTYLPLIVTKMPLIVSFFRKGITIMEAILFLAKIEISSS